MNVKRIYLIGACISLFVLTYHLLDITYGYIPKQNEVLNERTTEFQELVKYDVMGVFISPEEAKEIEQTKAGKELLQPQSGAIEVNERLVKDGRKSFYVETFDNEIFMTDVLGFVDGPLRIKNVLKAILELKGEGTTNLRVELAEDFEVGEKKWKKGDKVNTGLDVAAGGLTPLGVPISFSDGRVRVGISCALCHASVDEKTGKVMEGVPNNDLDTGLLLALGTNSAAHFPTANIESLQDYITDTKRSVTNSKGKKEALPDPDLFEKAVDESFLKWPKGSFDTSADMSSNPTQIPDVFTLGDHPYSWNGFAGIGPFKGLTTFNNKVHSFNSDTLSMAEHSEGLHDIDKEVFVGTILQRASHRKYRYDVESEKKPSQFFNEIDENPGAPGTNQSVAPPNFPKLSMFNPNGTIVTNKGNPIGYENNSMSAFQNSLVPPKLHRQVRADVLATGEEVFKRAGCISCHAGPTFTNHQIIPVEDIKTEPSRAEAMKAVQELLGDSLMYSPDTVKPIPENPTILRIPEEHRTKEQQNLAFSIGSKGGYKVKGLIGLAYTPPYLHDGGVAVGGDINHDIGVPGTLLEGKTPNAYNSLVAMVDQELRDKVIEANRSNPDLRDVHVEGVGHEFWVDETTGFTKEEQEALVEYLLSLTEAKEDKKNKK